MTYSQHYRERRQRGRTNFHNVVLKEKKMRITSNLLLILLAALITAGCGQSNENDKLVQPATKEKAMAPASAPAAPVRPSDAEFHAYKAYHHARYMVQTVEEVGGTNKLLHTKRLPSKSLSSAL